MPHNHGYLNHLAHTADCAFKVEVLTWMHVHLQRNDGSDAFSDEHPGCVWPIPATQ